MDAAPVEKTDESSFHTLAARCWTPTWEKSGNCFCHSPGVAFISANVEGVNLAKLMKALGELGIGIGRWAR